MDLRIDIKGQRKDVPVCIIYTINQYIACTGDMKFFLKVPVSLKKAAQNEEAPIFHSTHRHCTACIT
jgi:cellobiose phosphorylase